MYSKSAVAAAANLGWMDGWIRYGEGFPGNTDERMVCMCVRVCLCFDLFTVGSASFNGFYGDINCGQ